MLPNVLRKDLLVLSYEGLDEVTREARIQFSPEPLEITASQATFDIELDPKGETTVAVMVACDVGTAIGPCWHTMRQWPKRAWPLVRSRPRIARFRHPTPNSMNGGIARCWMSV